MATEQEPAHRRHMLAAITAEGEGHRALLEGDRPRARAAYHEAVAQYRASWESAPPAAYGRLVGMLKAAILGGEDVEDAARFARHEILDEEALASPAAAYARAIAALAAGDDGDAAGWASAMRTGGDAFERTGDALEALAFRRAGDYRAALEAIVADFAARSDHLTGVRIADTAAMLELLAEPRGLAVHVDSPLLP